MKKRVLPVLIVLVLICAIGGVYAARIIEERYAYSTERVDLEEWLGASGGDGIPVILNEERSELRAQRMDGVDYLRYEDVCDILTDRLYYGEADGMLFYVMPDAILSFEVGASGWGTDKGESVDEGMVLARMSGGELYIAVPFMARFKDISWQSFDAPDHLYLRTELAEATVADIAADTALRIRGGIKSEIMEELSEGETVIVLEEMENWTKVQSLRGYTGYVENKRLSTFRDTTLTPSEAAMVHDEDYPVLHRDHRINMGFHAIGGVGGNDTLTSYVSATKGLNVVAPTWFMIDHEDGSISDFGSEDYVARAHGLGLEVWGVVDNFNGGAAEVSTEEVLTHAQSRAGLIDCLIRRAGELSLDGINVDFENIEASYAPSYVEFIRELSLACHRAGLVISVDNYVPFQFNDYYKIEEQGVMADYVIIMGYDEHYAGSTEAGSVASIGYVESGIARATSLAPPGKVMLALPFYTRIWRTAQDGSVSSEAVTMPIARDFISGHSLTPTWDEATCQNYYEYTDSNGNLVQLWDEDASSIETKLNVCMAYGLGGVAEWELGYEVPEIWDVILPYVSQ